MKKKPLYLIILLAFISSFIPAFTSYAMGVPQINVVYDGPSGGFIIENVARSVDGHPTMLRGNISLNGENLESFTRGFEFYEYINEEKGALLFNTEHITPLLDSPGTVTLNVTYYVLGATDSDILGKSSAQASFETDGPGVHLHSPINTDSVAVQAYKERDALIEKGVDAISEEMATTEGLSTISDLESTFMLTCSVEFSTNVHSAYEDFIDPETLNIIGAVLNCAPDKKSVTNSTVQFDLSLYSSDTAAIPDGYELITACSPSLIVDGSSIETYICPIHISMPKLEAFATDDFYIYKSNGDEIDYTINEDESFSFIVNSAEEILFVKTAPIIEEPLIESTPPIISSEPPATEPSNAVVSETPSPEPQVSTVSVQKSPIPIIVCGLLLIAICTAFVLKRKK